MSTKLTDNQIEEIAEALGENIGKESKKMREIIEGNMEEVKDFAGIPENTEDKPYPYAVLNKGAMVESEEVVSIDPKTGVVTPVSSIGDGTIAAGTFTAAKNADVALTDVENFEQTVDIKQDSLGALKEYGLNEADIMKFVNIMGRYKNKEQFSVYNELPTAMKNMVKTLVPVNDKRQLNAAAKSLVEHFIRELYVEQEFVDLQESIKKELDIPNLAEMYADHLKNNMEVEMLKKADILEAEYPDKAELLRAVSKAFTDSYTFVRQKEALATDEKIKSKVRKDLTRYKRFCNDFNLKYSGDTKFKINDVRDVERVLVRQLSSKGITSDDIKKFVILFCKITEGMKPENVAEHTFMYYTIKNILGLDYIDLDKSEFSQILLNNIVETIEIMRKVEAEQSGDFS